MARQEGGQCSIGFVRGRLAWLGAVGVAGLTAYRKLRRTPPAVDRRADELRQKLDESRALVEEREEFESAETTVDAVEPPEVDDRRRSVHDRARAAAEEMRGRPHE
jgi:acetyl-CoA carboxylase carboxyltransferase component